MRFKGKKRFPLSTLAVLAGLLLALSAAACGDDDDNGDSNNNVNNNNNNNQMQMALVTVSDQEADPADQVVVDETFVPVDGWMIIHEDDAGAPGAIIGSAQLGQGTSIDIAVTLDRDVVDGETLWAMPHRDEGTPGQFEPQQDTPFTDDQDNVITESFVVTLPVQMMQSITASDQTLDTLSTQVTVDEAESEGPGWAVIHGDDTGSPGAVLGQTSLSDGSNAGIQVTLSRPAEDGETLWAMLHTDVGTIGTWEPAQDTPVLDASAMPLVGSFVVTVPAGTPAVSITIESVGVTAWQVNDVVPAEHADTVGPAAENTELFFESGWRYEVVNLVPTAHPFELIIMGTSPPTDDVVLLSQAATGTLEADATIDWDDGGGGTVRFTVSTALSSVMDGYRCSIHVANMRGTVTVQ